MNRETDFQDFWISPQAGVPKSSRRFSRFPGFVAGGLLLVLLLAGCSSHKKVARVPEVLPAVEEAAVTAPKRTYTVLTFEGVVEGVSVNGQLRVAEDSAMWVSVTKLIEVGRAMCTPDSLWLHAPLLGRDDAMDYTTLRRQTGVDITYDEMQQSVLAPDAEERVANLARRLGFAARIRITQRRQPDHLTFPYTKPVKQ
jgi:hypothetical protein